MHCGMMDNRHLLSGVFLYLGVVTCDFCASSDSQGKLTAPQTPQNLIAHGKPNWAFLGSGPWSIRVPGPLHPVTLPSLG